MTSQTVDATHKAKPVGSDLPSDASPSDTARPGFTRSAWLVPLASLAGVVMALGLVIAWFPKTWEMWNMPIQAIDAPSHYYFIRKLLKNGLSVIFELNPNDSYYPPLFHLMVYGLIVVADYIGITINIFTAFNIIWLFTSGVVFPTGMLLWSSYFSSDLPRTYRAGLNLIIPILSVVSAAFPYWLFNAGPLMAYGLATSLLPFSLYAGLRLIDVLMCGEARKAGSLAHWILINLVLGVFLLAAHPRIAFTYLVFMGFFLLLKLPWKFILSALGVLCSSTILFFVYMSYREHGKDFFHPSTWFHTFYPTRSLIDSLHVVLTDFIPGPAGFLMLVCIGVAVFSSLFMSKGRFKDGFALVCSYLLTSVIFISSASLKGPVANILTAAWYRGETRPLTMLPLATVPLLAFGARCIFLVTRESTLIWCRTVLRLLTALVLVVLTGACIFVNPNRRELADTVAANSDISQQSLDGQLSEAKFRALSRVKDLVGTQAIVVSDPLNGSMYGMTLYGMDMLYPVYNPMDTKNGRVFGDVERSFAGGDSGRLLNTVCPVTTSYSRDSEKGKTSVNKYFLTMGPQSPSLQMFTYRAQYYPFHSQALIDKYEHEGALQKVSEVANYPTAEGDWALYRFSCS